MARRSDVQTKTLKAFTLRLHDDTAAAFEKARGKRTIQEAGEDAIRDWVHQIKDPGRREDSTTWDSLRDIVVEAVSEELRSRPDWADAALKRTSLMDPTVSTYLKRVNHFHFEKLELSSRFVPWLVERALHHLETKQEVCLVIESGTTLKAIFDALGPELEKHPGIKTLQPGRIEIITNNFPGAESYETFAQSHKIGERRLAEIVPCHLVPGRALQEYSAVVGTRAENYLRDFCKPAKTKLRLGLVVGNWIMLEGNPARPTPLARGDGHKPFKEVVIANCDEAFLISPLCKIIVVPPGSTAAQRLAEFNRDFPDDKGDYFWVDMEPSKVRLVTTARLDKGSIVASHSVRVSDRVGISLPDMEPQPPSTPFGELRHLIYPYDSPSKKSVEEQLKRELPHERTRKKPFPFRYFNIQEDFDS